MLQQFMVPPSNEELGPQDTFKERQSLLFQIIQKMQNDYIPSYLQNPNGIIQNISFTEHFKEVWRTIKEQGCVSVRAAEYLHSFWHENNSSWFVNLLVEEILKCKFIQVI